MWERPYLARNDQGHARLGRRLSRRLQQSGLGESDFRVLEALLYQGP